MPRITDLYRYPIKAHGREAVEATDLIAGQTMPWDRVWAVAHEASAFDPKAPEWQQCGNFTRGAKAHGLQAMTAQLNEASGELTLIHPELGTLKIDPDTQAGSDALVKWTAPLVPENRAQSSYIAKAPNRGMTDTNYPTLSINNHVSRRALSKKAGQDLSPDRFRANIWIDNASPWSEFEWVGKSLRIGQAELKIEEPITRCQATTVNTETGVQDYNTLGLLNRLFDHQNFGIFATVTTGGRIAIGDQVEII